METTEKIVESCRRYVKQWFAAFQNIEMPFVTASSTGRALISAVLVIAPSAGLRAQVEHPGRYASGGDEAGSVFLVFIAVLIVVPAVGWTFILAWRLFGTLLTLIFGNQGQKADRASKNKHLGLSGVELSTSFFAMVFGWVIFFQFLAHHVSLLSSVFATVGVVIAIQTVFILLLLAFAGLSKLVKKR